MEGRPRTNPEQDRVLAQGRSSGECQRLKSDIYLSLSVWHSTLITNFPWENLLSEAFSLTILSFTVLILLNYLPHLYLTLSVWYGHNLRVHLSIGCPRYNYRPLRNRGGGKSWGTWLNHINWKEEERRVMRVLLNWMKEIMWSLKQRLKSEERSLKLKTWSCREIDFKGLD